MSSMCCPFVLITKVFLCPEDWQSFLAIRNYFDNIKDWCIYSEQQKRKYNPIDSIDLTFATKTSKRCFFNLFPDQIIFVCGFAKLKSEFLWNRINIWGNQNYFNFVSWVVNVHSKNKWSSTLLLDQYAAFFWVMLIQISWFSYSKNCNLI